MYLGIGDQDCWDACLAPMKPVPLTQKTNAYLHVIERGLRSEIADLGPDTDDAKSVWEKVFRVQRLSGVVVAAMVGGDAEAQQAAEFLTSPQPVDPPDHAPSSPSDPFEALMRRMAS